MFPDISGSFCTKEYQKINNNDDNGGQRPKIAFFSSFVLAERLVSFIC